MEKKGKKKSQISLSRYGGFYFNLIFKKSSGETFIRARHDFERQPSVQNRFVFHFVVEKVLLFNLNTKGLLEHTGPKRDVVINSLEKNVDF